MNTILFINANIVNEGKSFIGYVGISDKFISDVDKGVPSNELKNSYCKVVDLDGSTLMPGVIDTHVHFRDPGLTKKADMSTESSAALAGGVTSIIDMPNTKPTTTDMQSLKDKFDNANRNCKTNYSFFIGATNNNLDLLNSLDYTKVAGIKVFLGASTGSMLVEGDYMLDMIFSIPTLIAVHSEDQSIISSNSENLRKQYGDNIPISYHPIIRSSEACYECSRSAIERAKKLGTRLHLLHISTAQELELLDPSPLSSEKMITSEVTPCHLYFSDEDYAQFGAKIKCNPAIKSEKDRSALRQAFQTGLIDTVATDHAPHLLSDKEGDALHAASGIPSIQFSLLTMIELSKCCAWGIEKVCEKMSHAPATLFDIDRRGFIRKGYYADLVIIDTKSSTTVSKENILSKCGWSPFEGKTFSSKIVATLVNGQCVYKNKESFISKSLDIVNELVSMPLAFRK